MSSGASDHTNPTEQCLNIFSRLHDNMLEYLRSMPELPPGFRTLEKRKSDEIFSITRESDQRSIVTKATQRITITNIDSIFSHEYKPGYFGAKGLVYRHAKTYPLFWSTGVGKQGIEFHHRDALSFFLREEAKMHAFNSQIEEAPAAALLDALDQAGPKNEKTARNLAEMMLNAFDRDLKKHAYKSDHAAHLATNRKQSVFTKDDFFAAMGFQFTAKRGRDGKFRIVQFDVDSSILSALLAEADPNYELHPGDFIWNVRQMVEAIDPQVRDFKNVIRVKGLSTLRFLKPLDSVKSPFRFTPID